MFGVSQSNPLQIPESVFPFQFVLVFLGYLPLLLLPRSNYATWGVVLSTFLVGGLWCYLLWAHTTELALIPFSFLQWRDALSANPWSIVGFTHHAALLDLWVAKYISDDFYDNHQTGGFYWGRLVMTVNVLMTIGVGPVSFVLYYALRESFFVQLRTFRPRRGQNSDLLDAPRHPADKGTVVNVLLCFPAFLSFVLHFGGFILLCIYCFIYSKVYGSDGLAEQQRKAPLPGPQPRLSPKFLRNVSAKERLRLLTVPTAKRGCWWNIRHRILQTHTLVEYMANAENPQVLFTALENSFGPYYPFGDGIGINKHDDVVRLLQDPTLEKSFESLGWEVSSTMSGFARWTTIFIPQSAGDRVRLDQSRAIIHTWLANFPGSLDKPLHREHIHKLLVPNGTKIPSKTHVYHAFGTTLFYLATLGELRREEKAAYQDAVENPSSFLPNWFNFILGARFKERKNGQSFETLRLALARYSKGKALRAALLKGQEFNWTPAEVLRLVAFVFSVAGAAAPAKLTVSVVEKLYQDPVRMLGLFNENPKRFIVETSRLDKVVPMVNVRAKVDSFPDALNIDGTHLEVQTGTPLHCSITNANRDPSVFGTASSLGFADIFDVNRPNLGQTLSWNGVDNMIEPSLYAMQDNGIRPPRYCPGRHLSLNIIKLIALHFTPQNDEDLLVLSLEKQHTYRGAMDRYCRTLIAATKAMAVKWNANPPSAGDILEPQPMQVEQLKLYTIPDWGLTLPGWDEDEHHLELLKDLILKDINSYARMFNEQPEEELYWEEPLDGTAWLKFLWGTNYPAVVVDYGELSSDRAIEHLAFASAASLYTRRIEEADLVHLPQAKANAASPKGRRGKKASPVEAAFVCDFLALAEYPVREGFGRYGAIAYFNADRQIVAIYVSDSRQTYYPGQPDWEKAKWFFKSSFFVTVTFVDHLVDCHLISANGFVTANRKLPYDHPLRRFTKAFTYRTIRINDAAHGSLINRWGLVHRIWALDYDDLSAIAKNKADNFKLIPFPERVHPSMRGLPREEFPLGVDAPAYYQVVRSFVGAMWALIFPTGLDQAGQNFVRDLETYFHVSEEDNFDPVDIVTQLVVNGTAYHELVGQVSDYLRGPQWIGAKLRPFEDDQMRDSVTGYTMLQSLVLLTGLRMPNLLDDWRHLLPATDVNKRNIDTEANDIYDRFLTDLEELAAQIDAGNQNKTLLHRFMACHPAQLETSVSI